MADWEEIKRLAADFQRAQLTSTVQRLSERNCIEIVKKLGELKLIDVIYTTDGKEYLTPTELFKEIKEELQVHGGRINLVELQQIINVDFTHIESKASELARSDKNITLVLGQLIDEIYLDRVAEEINDKLQDQGQITFAELTKTYDIPANFFRGALLKRLGCQIQGRIDDFNRDVIYTEALVATHRAKIRGALSAIIKPTPLMNIINNFNLQERIFYIILDGLIASKRLAGSISGGRQDKALYVPDVYTKTQTEWVDNFYRQNGYLEYDAVSRLGITDPKSYIKKRYKNEPLVYLSSCCAGKLLQEQLEAEVDEALSSDGWVDVMPLLPSIFSREDASQLLQRCLRTRPQVCVYCDTIVTSDMFIQACSKPFRDIMATKADKDAKSNMMMLTGQAKVKVEGLEEASPKENPRDNRKKKSGKGSGGAGTQGREVKTKATKKKYGKHKEKEVDSDEETETPSSKGKTIVPFLSPEEIETEINKHVKDVPDDFIQEIAARLHRPLTQQYQEIVRSVFLQSAGAASGSDRKKTHGDLSEKITGLYTNVKLFEKGIKCFNDDMQTQLVKHLLKTVCTDIANIVFAAVATEHMLNVNDEKEITPEMRVALLGKIPDEIVKATLTKLHTSLNKESLDTYYEHLEKACGPSMLGVGLKKTDKKKERQLVFGHRQMLTSQLKDETDPAMVLHLATVLIFQIHTQCMIHVPGRMVPQLVSFLQEYIKEEEYQQLCTCRDLVVKQLKAHEDGIEDITSQLSELVPQVKQVALNTRKGGANKEEDT